MSQDIAKIYICSSCNSVAEAVDLGPAEQSLTSIQVIGGVGMGTQLKLPPCSSKTFHSKVGHVHRRNGKKGKITRPLSVAAVPTS